jgi:predicted phage replisome organizer/uncharacterized phage protein (TIGR02220 family)
MAEVKWIKINVDMFDDEKIKIIQAMPDGDSILVIWLKMITLAGKTNDGGYIYISDNIPYTDEMLSIIMNKPIMTIKLAMDTFLNLRMVENDTKGIYLVNFEKHQSLEKMEHIKEQNRIRKQRERDKKLLESRNMSRDISVTSRDSHATDIDIDKDIDKDKELEKEEKEEKETFSHTSGIDYPYISIIDYLNTKAGTNYRATTEKTKSVIRARFLEGFDEENFRTVIDKKCAEWIGTEWEKFLRPETLFGTKFESYLNANVVMKSEKQTQSDGWDYINAVAEGRAE